jgi:hypothetical protein
MSYKAAMSAAKATYKPKAKASKGKKKKSK